jgi:molybdopterin synthase catalytic subunit
MHLEVRVQTEDFSVAAEYDALRRRLPAHTGAVVTFVGLVRDLHAVPAGDAPAAEAPAGGIDKTGAVQALHLEHYPGMTERSIEAIGAKAQARWPLLDLLVIHRVGTLAPEAQIVFVQVASSHRAAAFAACEFVMDYLKTDAVFWKREDTATGSHWVEATGEDHQRVSGWRAPGSSPS